MTVPPVEEMTGPLAEWLAERLGEGQLRLEGFSRPAGSGYSAETVMFTAVGDSGGRRRLVLRRETPEPPIYPVQAPGLDVEVDIQYRVMDALRRCSDVPVAPLLGYEPDAAVLGAPFFVMGHVDGDVPIENPLYTRTGFFVDATPDQRRAMINDGIAVLAKVHGVDWRAAGLDWLVPPRGAPGTAAQLALWAEHCRRELAGRSHPVLESAFRWLDAHLPRDEPVALSWGDARLGNMIWSGHRCVCATDWEAASISPPQIDLGWWLMFDHWVHETAGVARLPGEPTREEQKDLYEELTGRRVGDTYYYEVFAAARYSVIVVRVMNRLVARGALPGDHTIWLDNPAAACLQLLMDV